MSTYTVRILTSTFEIKAVGEKEDNEAIFYTAAIWLWNSDLETGNYAPNGETAPTMGKDMSVLSRVTTMDLTDVFTVIQYHQELLVNFGMP